MFLVFVGFVLLTVSFNNIKNCFYLDVQVNTILCLESEYKHIM